MSTHEHDTTPAAGANGSGTEATDRPDAPAAEAPLRSGHVAAALPAWSLEPPRTLLTRARGA